MGFAVWCLVWPVVAVPQNWSLAPSSVSCGLGLRLAGSHVWHGGVLSGELLVAGPGTSSCQVVL